jgi:hypothetical protein
VNDGTATAASFDALMAVHDRELKTLCRRYNEALTKHIVEVAQRLQAVSETLADVRRQLRADVRAQTDLKPITNDGWQQILAEPVFAADLEFVNVRVPRGCDDEDSKTGVPTDLGFRFPGVRVEMEESQANLSIELPEGEVTRGIAEGRADNQQP